MAALDIVLRLLGDARNAQKAYKDVATAAKQAGTEVDKTNAKMAQSSTAAGRMTFGDRARGVMAWGRNGGFAAAGAAVAGAIGAAEAGGRAWDAALGIDRRMRNDERAIGLATNGADLNARVRSLIAHRATGFNESGGIPGAVRHLFGGIFKGTNPGDEARRQELLEWFTSTLDSDPALAQAFVNNMGNDYKGITRSKLQQMIDERKRANAFQARGGWGGTTVNQTIQAPMVLGSAYGTGAGDAAYILAAQQRINPQLRNAYNGRG